MQFFPALQHRHKVCDPFATSFGFFGGGDAEVKAVALRFIESCEEGFCTRFLRQSGEEILWLSWQS